MAKGRERLQWNESFFFFFAAVVVATFFFFLVQPPLHMYSFNEGYYSDVTQLVFILTQITATIYTRMKSFMLNFFFFFNFFSAVNFLRGVKGMKLYIMLKISMNLSPITTLFIFILYFYFYFFEFLFYF